VGLVMGRTMMSGMEEVGPARTARWNDIYACRNRLVMRPRRICGSRTSYEVEGAERRGTLTMVGRILRGLHDESCCCMQANSLSGEVGCGVAREDDNSYRAFPGRSLIASRRR
jgi:hypothetical protein